jgi:hopene-associated glycosyltransferase HpnB
VSQRAGTTVTILIVAAAAAAAAWACILAGHGQSWRTDQRLPGRGPGPALSPTITIVIPARDEAAALPLTLPTLLGQDYHGSLRAVLVDDESSDGTAAVAADLGKAAGWAVAQQAGGDPAPPAAIGDHDLLIIGGRPLPAGWAGKVWAMSQGAAAAGDAEYLLFTDADISYAPGAVTALAQAASAGQFGLVSQMALLRAEAPWERVLVPAFVYFFAQLYPFRLVNRPHSRTAAAAGGCMLVNRAVLARAGGLEQIRAARIDDVALGKLLKRKAGSRCWLGLTRDVVSVREYPGISDVWDMVARSAFTQLRYSLLALAGVLVGLSWLYLLPPAAVIGGLAALAAGGGAPAGWLAAAGAAGWVMMSASYVPILRYYRLSASRAPVLPVIAGLYAAMTADSARRHLAGQGGAWKGRIVRR